VGGFSLSTGQVTRHHWIPVIHKPRSTGRAYPLIEPISGDHSQASYRAMINQDTAGCVGEGTAGA
jgi:hypothetical protein